MATTHFQTFIDAFAAVEPSSRLMAGDDVRCPPSEDYGYESTPVNAVAFASMGVDGVHCAVLKIEGQVRDDSPVIHVSPMDSEDVIVLAGSFLNYLADGCGVSVREMQEVFDVEVSGRRQLVSFLSAHFDGLRLLGEERTRPLTARYGHLIERKAPMSDSERQSLLAAKLAQINASPPDFHIRLAGWRAGFEKVTATQLIRAHTHLDIADSKRCVDDCLAGKESLLIPKSVPDACQLATKLSRCGAVIAIEKPAPTPRTEPAPTSADQPSGL